MSRKLKVLASLFRFTLLVIAASSTTAQVTHPTPIVDNDCAKPPANMISWWPLDETSGNTVVDIIGGHNGTTNVGSDPWVASSPKVGGALLFASSKATVGGTPYNFGTGSFSIDAWVRGPVNNAALGIVDKLDPLGKSGFAFFVRNKMLQLTMGNGSTPLTFSSPPLFVYNSWQHVAVTVQRIGTSAIGIFYLNGAQIGPSFVPPLYNINNTANLLLGNYHLNGGGCSSCEVTLDEVEIFGDAVSPTDIKAIFQANTTGKCKPPLWPDLTIVKQVRCGTSGAQDICNVIVTIGNAGPGSFNGFLVVTDVITPAPTSVSWGAASPGWTCTIGPPNISTCVHNGPVSLAPGQSFTLNLQVKFTVGQYKNCASVKGYLQQPFTSANQIKEVTQNNNQSCVPMP